MKKFCKNSLCKNQAEKYAKVWVLAIADKGMIVHARAFTSEIKAKRALTDYLRTYENYRGSDNFSEVLDWVEQHQERLSVDLCSTPVDNHG